MTTHKTFIPAFKLEIAKLIVDENFTIKQACKASGVGETALKRWCLQVHVKAVHTEPRQTYGSRRMSSALKA